MRHGAILLTWFLLASSHMLRCTGDVCEVVPQTIVPLTRLTHFESRHVCEDYRRTLEERTPPVVRSQGRPDVTVRREMTFTCRMGD